jgi:hypothetical protein
MKKKIMLLICIAALFIGMVAMPVEASLSGSIVKSAYVEQNENEGTHYRVFGRITGYLKIENVVSCEQIGDTDWYSNVEITGYAPYTDMGIFDFSVGRLLWHGYADKNIHLTVRLIQDPPDLKAGNTVDFGWLGTFGIGIKVDYWSED